MNQWQNSQLPWQQESATLSKRLLLLCESAQTMVNALLRQLKARFEAPNVLPA